VFVVLFFSLPETSSDKILLQRAKRLRELTGRDDLRSQSEILSHTKSAKQIVFNALIKPWEINIKDLAMLFTTVYTALIYGLYYSFFESFPLIYQDIYHFNLGELGLAFLSVLVGLLIALVFYCSYFHWIADPRYAKSEQEGIEVQPEARLVPGLFGTFLIPIGIFIYGKLPDTNILSGVANSSQPGPLAIRSTISSPYSVSRSA